MDRLSLAIFSRNAANRVLCLLHAALFSETPKIIRKLRNHPGKILLLRTGNIGDTACALPALAAIRENFPRAHLCLLTSPGPRGLPEAGQVLDGQDLVNESSPSITTTSGTGASAAPCSRTCAAEVLIFSSSCPKHEPTSPGLSGTFSSPGSWVSRGLGALSWPIPFRVLNFAP